MPVVSPFSPTTLLPPPPSLPDALPRPLLSPLPTGAPPPPTVIQAVLQFQDIAGLMKWRVDYPSGCSITIGDSLVLTDPALNKTTSPITVLRIREWQRYWIVFNISSHPGSTLSVPRSRVRLGFIGALQHFLLRPWLPDTIPPPFSCPLPGFPNYIASRRCLPSSSRSGGGNQVLGVCEQPV